MKLSSRHLLASIVLLGAAAPISYEFIRHASVATSPRIPIAFLSACAIYLSMVGVLHVRRLEPQILVRAVIWACLVTSVLMSIVINGHQTSVMILTLGLGTGTALLILGASGLDDPSTSQTFVPVAFRGVLVAILIMALADMGTLFFWGGMLLEEATSQDLLTGFMLVGGSIMLLAVCGLYRLRAWGFGLNILANITIAITAFIVPKMPLALATCLAATAVGQLLVGLPLLRGIAKGAPAPQSTDFRIAGGWSRMVVLGLMATVIVARVVHGF